MKQLFVAISFALTLSPLAANAVTCTKEIPFDKITRVLTKDGEVRGVNKGGPDAILPVTECQGYVRGGLSEDGEEILEVFADGTLMVPKFPSPEYNLVKPKRPVPALRAGDRVVVIPGGPDFEVYYYRLYRKAKVVKAMGTSSLIEVDRSSLRNVPESRYAPYIYQRAGLATDDESSETVLMKVTNSRLMKATTCYKDLCVGQRRSGVYVDAGNPFIVREVYSNGIFYWDSYGKFFDEPGERYRTSWSSDYGSRGVLHGKPVTK